MRSEETSMAAQKSNPIPYPKSQTVAAPERIAQSQPAARPRLDGLTALRFFAAFHVILFHLYVEGILSVGPWWYRNFASIGYVGVNFFFVLSGFILVYTYAASDLDPRRFWQARFARVYPAYLFSLAVTAPFFFLTAPSLNLPFFAWSMRHLFLASVLALALLQSWVPQGALTWNPVCWSLSVEAFFYALFPFLLKRTKPLSRRGLPFWIAAAWLVSLSISAAYIVLHPDGAANINSTDTTLFWKNVLSFNPLVRLPEFVVGMLTCRLFLLSKRSRGLGTICILSGVAGFVLVTIFANNIPNPVVSTGLLSPAFAAIIYGVALQPRWTRFLALAPLVYLGEASYSLYLLHSWVISSVVEAVPHWPLAARVVLCLAAAIAASLLTYKFIEQPARKLLRPKTARKS
jgi:peptidoglycan/LPS O-acetylase OafA/YrhL